MFNGSGSEVFRTAGIRFRVQRVRDNGGTLKRRTSSRMSAVFSCQKSVCNKLQSLEAPKAIALGVQFLAARAYFQLLPPQIFKSSMLISEQGLGTPGAPGSQTLEPLRASVESSTGGGAFAHDDRRLRRPNMEFVALKA